MTVFVSLTSSKSMNLKKGVLWMILLLPLWASMMFFPTDSYSSYRITSRIEPVPAARTKVVIDLPPTGPKAANPPALRTAMCSRMKSLLLDSCMPYSEVICLPWEVTTIWKDGREKRWRFRDIKTASVRTHALKSGKVIYVVALCDKEKTLIDFISFGSPEKRQRFMKVLQFMIEGQNSLEIVNEILGKNTPVCSTRLEAIAVLKANLIKAKNCKKLNINDDYIVWTSNTVIGAKKEFPYRLLKEVISGKGTVTHEDDSVGNVYMCLLKTPQSGPGYEFFVFKSLDQAHAVHHAFEFLRDLH
jgi:hypothetical protein